MRRFVEIEGKRYLWREFSNCGASKRVGAEKQLVLFELKKDDGRRRNHLRTDGIASRRCLKSTEPLLGLLFRIAAKCMASTDLSACTIGTTGHR